MNHRISIALLAAAAAVPATAQVQLQLVQTVDLTPTATAGNPEYIGSNPVAVAWNGTDLWVAGYNNDNPNNPPQNCGIVQITGALSGSPTFGAAFGVVSTPGFRGYSGLDIEGQQLAAAYDPGTSSAQGIAAYDLSGNQQWTKAARGGSGVGFDPGIPGGTAAGRGVAWTTFGSGRRSLQDAAIGADIWTSANGMIISTPEGTFWRDMDFDPATGDVWTREGNNLIRSVRNGDNSVAQNIVVYDANPEADFVAQQNVAYVDTPAGDIVIFNDRPTVTPPQDFFQVVRAVRPDGTPQALDFGSFSPNTGNGAYDFSWDAGTQTLAIVDFQNREAHVFSVTVPPYYPYGDGCVGSNNLVPQLELSGTGQPGSTLTYTITDATPNTTAFIVFGAVQGSTQLVRNCRVLVDPLLPVFLGALNVDPAGSAQATLTLPGTGISGAQFTQQAAIIDSALGGVLPFATSNGVLIVIP